MEIKGIKQKGASRLDYVEVYSESGRVDIIAFDGYFRDVGACRLPVDNARKFANEILRICDEISTPLGQ